MKISKEASELILSQANETQRYRDRCDLLTTLLVFMAILYVVTAVIVFN